MSLLLRFPKSGNEDLALSLTQWVFKEKGVLRVGAVKHNKQGEKEPPQAYTVFDMVVSTSVPTQPQFTQFQTENKGVYILPNRGTIARFYKAMFVEYLKLELSFSFRSSKKN